MEIKVGKSILKQKKTLPKKIGSVIKNISKVIGRVI